MIFSFSQPVWNDLIFSHKIVLQDDTYYYVITFTDPKENYQNQHNKGVY